MKPNQIFRLLITGAAVTLYTQLLTKFAEMTSAETHIAIYITGIAFGAWFEKILSSNKK